MAMEQENITEKKPCFSLTQFLKKNLLTGIAILFPVFATVYLVFFVFNLADRLTGIYLNDFLISRYGYTIPGLGILIALSAIFFIGLVYNHFFGKSLFFFFEKIIMSLPLISTVYPSAKQLSNFIFSAKDSRGFKKTVLVEFLSPDTFAVGFVTNKDIHQFNKAAGKDIVCVFVPLAPSPFSGHIIAVPYEKVHEVDIPVDAAIRFIMSGGVAFTNNISKAV